MGNHFVNKLLCAIFLIALYVSCGSAQTNNNTSSEDASFSTLSTQKFNADSAYLFVSEQVAFGPRIPKSEAHKACRDYLEKKLKSYQWTTSVQRGSAKIYDGSEYPVFNIIGSINPNYERRILLSAHYDTRPFADQEDINKQLDGANDGASGVGVLIELARLLSNEDLKIGVDIIFWDLEDYGEPKDFEGSNKSSNPQSSYCLGSYFWSHNPHMPGYRAMYNINLDMVGAKDATFFHEGYSYQYAKNVGQFVWGAAKELGYEKYFIDQPSVQIYDDHVSVLSYGIPAIDIIHLDTSNEQVFFDQWHTSQDDMTTIDKEVLKVVGEVVFYTILKESRSIKTD